MRAPHGLSALLLLAAVLSGCGSTQEILTNEQLKSRSVVIVYLEADEMGGDFEWFKLKQGGFGQEPVYWDLAVKENAWAYHVGIPKGAYQITSYGGLDGFDVGCGYKMCSNTHYTYRFPAQGGGFKIEERGVYFLGAWRHKKAGSFFDAKFDLERLKRPTEKEAVAKTIHLLREDNKDDLDSVATTLQLLDRHYKSLK